MELAGLSSETEVGDGGNVDVDPIAVLDVKAGDPLIFCSVLQINCQIFVLEISDTRLRGNGGATNSPSLQLC
jgi:hypothetical protein